MSVWTHHFRARHLHPPPDKSTTHPTPQERGRTCFHAFGRFPPPPPPPTGPPRSSSCLPPLPPSPFHICRSSSCRPALFFGGGWGRGKPSYGSPIRPRSWGVGWVVLLSATPPGLWSKHPRGGSHHTWYKPPEHMPRLSSSPPLSLGWPGGGGLFGVHLRLTHRSS